ncbi:MAG: efflux RND transporter periplasmic adaptor subunit [Vampirovibrionales bacterium]|nr:efflux RND transporter periplasmic adaptor subunit [Vampirovibrionales bacterium]
MASLNSAPKPVVALVLLAVVVGGWFVWNASTNHDKSQAAAPPVMPVVLAKVEPTVLEDAVELMARVTSRNSAELRPEVSGKLTQILVSPGQQVRAGQVLAVIDPRRQQAAVAALGAATQAARARQMASQQTASVAQSELTSAQAELRYAQEQYTRYETLSAQQSVSTESFQDVTKKLEQAKAHVAALQSTSRMQQANVEAAKAATHQANAQAQAEAVMLGYHRIVAPVSGVVGDIPQKVGDYVMAGMPFTTITGAGKLEIEVAVPADAAVGLTVGKAMTLLSSDGKTVLGQATVFYAASRVDPESQTVLVKARVNANEKVPVMLRDEQRIRARLVKNRSEALTVPTSAIVRQGGKTSVYVAEKQVVTKEKSAEYTVAVAPVILGLLTTTATGEDVYVVTQGLKKGQLVVTKGVQKLGPGAHVTDYQPE